MKKGVKITLIVAAVLILMGGIMALICLAMGASWSEAEIKFKNPLKWESHEENHAGNHVEHSGVFEMPEDMDTMDFSGEAIHSLNLDMEAGTLYIQTGEEYMVGIANGRDNMRCEVRNGVLIVKETDSFQTLIHLGSKDSYPVITVVVPEGTVVDAVTITVGAGVVEAKNLRTKNMEVDVDAGSFSCQDLYVEDRCEIDVDAGGASILGGHIEGSLHAEVDAGLIYYEGQIAGDWDADCAMGSIEMILTGAEEDYNYQIECDLGNVFLGSREFTGLSTDKRIDHNAHHDAQVSCDMGSISITFTH